MNTTARDWDLGSWVSEELDQIRASSGIRFQIKEDFRGIRSSL